MKRTLSIGSRVPPAVTSTRSPRGTAASAGASTCLEQLRRLGQPADPVLAV